MTEDMRALLDYFCGNGANSGLTKDIDAGVAYAKSFKPWEAEYMQFHEMEQDARRIGYKEGRAEGEAQTKMDAIDRLVASGLTNKEKACEVLGVPIEEYEKYKAESCV